MISSQKLSESELVAGCQKGEARYQRALYDRYHRLMFGVCLRYTDNRTISIQDGWASIAKSLSRGNNIEEGHYMERLWAGLLCEG